MRSTPIQDEVSLMDYLKVIRSHKVIIAVVFCLILLAVIIFSLSQPKIYQGKVLLKVGQINGQPIQTSRSMLAFLNNHPEIKLVAPTFEIEFEGEGYIVLKVEMHSSETVTTILDKTAAILINEHQQIIAQTQQTLEQQAAAQTKQKTELEEKLSQMEKEIVLIQNQIKRFQSANSEAQALALVAYLERLTFFEKQKDTLEVSLASLKKPQPLTYVMTQVQSRTKTIVSSNRVILKKNLPITAVVALFLTLGLAFIKDWWRKNRHKLKN